MWRVTENDRVTVACDGDAAEPVRFAASELSSYLGRVLGCDITAGSTAASDPADGAVRIRVESGTASSGPDDEAYTIGTADDGALVVRGKARLARCTGCTSFCDDSAAADSAGWVRIVSVYPAERPLNSRPDHRSGCVLGCGIGDCSFRCSSRRTSFVSGWTGWRRTG